MSEMPIADCSASSLGVVAAVDENFDYYEDEDEYEGEEVHLPAPGRPRSHIRNGNAAPRPQVLHDDDHIAKLKLTPSPLEGKYDPDAYLTWELETDTICMLKLA